MDPFLVWLILVILGGIWVLHRWGLLTLPRRNSFAHDGPIISSAGLLTSGSLASVHKGEYAGFQFNLIAAGSGRIIVFIQLHRKSRLHLIAIGDKSRIGEAVNKALKQHNLTKVDLEGDFPSYFTMYCTPDKELELLHLFDPADMAYFADFCRAYDFELYNDTIYISQAGDAKDKEDMSTLVADVEMFLKRNHRFLEKVETSNPIPTAQGL